MRPEFGLNILLSASLSIMPQLATAPKAISSDDGASGRGVFGSATDDSIVVGRRAVGKGQARTVGAEYGGEGPAYIHRRPAQYYCGSLDATSTVAPCVDDVASAVVVRTCPDGTRALDPLQRRPVDPVDGTFTGPWERVDDGGCPGDDVLQIGLTAEEFQRLPLTASQPSFQPADGRALVNVDLIVFTDPAPQQLVTSVLGVPVTVRAAPVSYRWDFGDGSPILVTTDPGAPYPRHTISHPYAVPGNFQVRLVTTWAGQYQVNGAGPWLDVAGTAETSSPPFAVSVEEARSRLVAEPLP